MQLEVFIPGPKWLGCKKTKIFNSALLLKINNVFRNTTYFPHDEEVCHVYI